MFKPFNRPAPKARPQAIPLVRDARGQYVPASEETALVTVAANQGLAAQHGQNRQAAAALTAAHSAGSGAYSVSQGASSEATRIEALEREVALMRQAQAGHSVSVHHTEHYIHTRVEHYTGTGAATTSTTPTAGPATLEWVSDFNHRQQQTPATPCPSTGTPTRFYQSSGQATRTRFYA